MILHGDGHEGAQTIARAAAAQIGETVLYDPAYVALEYPMGDVPRDRGVCTDVVVRAMRGAGVDLQVLIHDDMKRAFESYPQRWGASRPDANIDHRRVPNMMTFFERRGRALPVTRLAGDYWPGDVVAWRLGSGRLHVGVVSRRWTDDGERPLIVHNVGAGARLDDVLWEYELIGHYRWFGPSAPPLA